MVDRAQYRHGARVQVFQLNVRERVRVGVNSLIEVLKPRGYFVLIVLRDDVNHRQLVHRQEVRVHGRLLSRIHEHLSELFELLVLVHCFALAQVRVPVLNPKKLLREKALSIDLVRRQLCCELLNARAVH